MIQKRSIPLCIILSLVTCGIYGLYWIYCIVNDLNRVYGEYDSPSGGMVILLSIVTCGIYELYWLYKAGEKIDTIRLNNNLPAENNGLLYLLLSLFKLTIVSWALLQSELNQFAEG